MSSHKQVFYAVAKTAHWTAQCPTLRRTVRWMGRTPHSFPLSQGGKFSKCSTCWPYEPAEEGQARRANGR